VLLSDEEQITEALHSVWNGEKEWFDKYMPYCIRLTQPTHTHAGNTYTHVNPKHHKHVISYIHLDAQPYQHNCGSILAFKDLRDLILDAIGS